MNTILSYKIEKTFMELGFIEVVFYFVILNSFSLKYLISCSEIDSFLKSKQSAQTIITLVKNNKKEVVQRFIKRLFIKF